MGETTQSTIRQKAVNEVREMTIIFVYLATLFCMFMAYRQLVMEELGVRYFNYGFALIKAIVLAKVIVLGQHSRVSKLLDHMPLIVPTMYKTFVFTVFMMLFEILEHAIGGRLHGRPMAESVGEILSVGRAELLSRMLIVLVALIPFFAFQEIGRVMGEGKLFELFFRKSATRTTDSAVPE